VESSDVVVVVGGGATGASVAWQLDKLGVGGVVLLERDSLAAGSTSRSAGGILTQFAEN
jgi:sarcosine oxidase subunit beta